TTPIGNDDIEKELIRLWHAFEETLAELDQYAQRIEGEFDAALTGIFRAHGEMLRSLFASGEFERELRASLLTAEAVVGGVLQRWYRKFEATENQTLRQRADDVLDLGRNIIRRLRGEQGAGFEAVPEELGDVEAPVTVDHRQRYPPPVLGAATVAAPQHPGR